MPRRSELHCPVRQQPQRGWSRGGSKAGPCQDEQGPTPGDSRRRDRGTPPPPPPLPHGTERHPRNGGRRPWNRTGANPRTAFRYLTRYIF